MGDTILFTAALKKGDQKDVLVLDNGETVSLPICLPYASGERVVVHIVPRDRENTRGSTLAKQILQEILESE